MELRTLEYFLAVVKEGNISGAAQALQVLLGQQALFQVAGEVAEGGRGVHPEQQRLYFCRGWVDLELQQERRGEVPEHRGLAADGWVSVLQRGAGGDCAG